ncbi:AAA family ATPase [Deinococcus misasensis]|uniref:AAA family ATPase n=1 Tax=Deinococcus misasensis TaxID=392413 RepID=UPI000A065CC3|nr:AAA family ATPase [Deinococcus misasensis]
MSSFHVKQVQHLASLVLEGQEVAYPEWKVALSPFLDWYPQLEVTPQDPEWHAEGSVDIHTALVLQELSKILQEGDFTPYERLTLTFAALLHDIGKANTTRFREGRMVSPGHAVVGRDYLSLRLLSAGFSAELVRRVIALVGHHHDPKHFVVKNAPERMYRRLARTTELPLLYFLEQADIRGRWASDLEDQLQWLDLFKLQCEEYGLWDEDPHQAWLEPIRDQEAYVQQSAILDYEEGRIFSPEEAISRSYLWRNRPSELTVLCGLSGSGKSTWIKENHPDTQVISMDDLREDLSGDRGDQSINGQVWQQAREDLKKALREGRKVIWDATNIRKLSRERLVNLGLDYHAHVKMVVFQVAPEEAIKRNRLREHAVPAGVIASQVQGFQFPELFEAHEVQYID